MNEESFNMWRCAEFDRKVGALVHPVLQPSSCGCVF